MFPIKSSTASEMAHFHQKMGGVLKYFAPVRSNRRKKFEFENQFEVSIE